MISERLDFTERASVMQEDGIEEYMERSQNDCEEWKEMETHFVLATPSNKWSYSFGYTLEENWREQGIKE